MFVKQKGISYLPLLLTLVMLGIVGYAIYNNMQPKQPPTLPLPLEKRSDTDDKSPPIGRVDDNSEYDSCIAAVSEEARTICVAETGFDPGPIKKEDILDLVLSDNDENINEIDFWTCYEIVSSEQEIICEDMYADSFELRSLYYQCLSQANNIMPDCAQKTGYTAELGFPEEKYEAYLYCIETAEETQDSNCQSETGFTP